MKPQNSEESSLSLEEASWPSVGVASQGPPEEIHPAVASKDSVALWGNVEFPPSGNSLPSPCRPIIRLKAQQGLQDAGQGETQQQGYIHTPKTYLNFLTDTDRNPGNMGGNYIENVG